MLTGFSSILIFYLACVTVAAAKPIPILYIILGIVGGLIFLAFLLLIAWKIAITAYVSLKTIHKIKESTVSSLQFNYNSIF